MISILPDVRLGTKAGLCLLPTCNDGSKKPDVDSWTPFKSERPSVEQLRAWDFAHRDGFGMIAGPVSGHRECFDFDGAGTLEAFIAAAEAAGLGDLVRRLRDGYEDRTPGGGGRWLFEYPPEIAWKDETFARRPGRAGDKDPSKPKALIETCTFTILAPSNGRTHETGRPYVRVSGGFDTIPRVTADERAAIVALARSFDQMPRPAAYPPRSTPRPADGDERPGDAFNRLAAWPEILPDWTEVYTRGETIYLRRPGKDRGISATVNHGGSDLLYVFSSSTPFDPEKSYSKFAAFSVLHHGGDFSAAGKALARDGYGTRPDVHVERRRSDEPPPEAPTFARPAVAGGLGQCVLQPLAFRPYTGWFARGAVHLIAGSSGAGKSTLMLDLLRMQARRAPYLGHSGAGLDFLVLFADRGTVSNAETLARMRIDSATLPIDHLPATTSGGAALQAALDAIERCPEIPAVVFIEGADLLVEEPCKPQIVTPFVVGLRRLAEHYSLSIVLSVGAAKSRPQEQYQLKRDRVFGSQAWSRLCDTVLILSITGDGLSATRELDVLHRNAAPESFRLTFTDGLLVEAAPGTASGTDLVAWFREAEVFSAAQFRGAFPKLSGARAVEILESYVGLKVLGSKSPEGKRTSYWFRRDGAIKASRADIGLSNSELDEIGGNETTSKIVLEKSGKDTAELEQTAENIGVSAAGFWISQFPPKMNPLSNSEEPSRRELDKGHATGGIRARESDDIHDELLPDWVTADELPLAADDSDAVFAAHDAADIDDDEDERL